MFGWLPAHCVRVLEEQGALGQSAVRGARMEEFQVVSSKEVSRDKAASLIGKFLKARPETRDMMGMFTMKSTPELQLAGTIPPNKVVQLMRLIIIIHIQQSLMLLYTLRQTPQVMYQHPPKLFHPLSKIKMCLVHSTLCNIS